MDNIIPTGYLSIRTTYKEGEIIISLNKDNSYGNVKEYFPDGDMFDLSPSFTQLLNDMVESEEDDE